MLPSWGRGHPTDGTVENTQRASFCLKESLRSLSIHLSRLKGLIESETTPGPTLMAAIREVLERTRYEDPHLLTMEELRPHIQRHIAMLKAEQATVEARIPKELPASPRVQHFGFYNDDGEFVWEDRPIKPRR